MLLPDDVCMDSSASSANLITIKAFHSVAWAFLAGCILVIPFATQYGVGSHQEIKGS